jgi:hypothetical protein
VNIVTLQCNPTATGADGGGGDSGAGDDGGAASSCPYGATEFGQESDDDDCKYHVAWTSTPICEKPGAVMFTVVVTNIAGGGPLKGAGTFTEVFTTTPGDQDAAGYCDNLSTRLSPNSGATLTEGPPGTYVGPIVFDQRGAWTVRLHFFGNCVDAPTAPHGHAAFHITVP